MCDPWRRQSVCLLLSLVMLLASTTGSLRHAHEPAGPPPQPGLSAAPTRPAHAHRHLLLLGFEVYEEECPAPPADGRPLEQITAGIDLDARVPRIAPPGERLIAPCPFPADLTSPAPLSPAPRARVSPPACCSLPAVATHTRSGVLSV